MMEDLKAQAIQILKEDFHPDLQCELTLERTIESHPFREPGTTALFSFVPYQDRPEKFYIFTGNVMPMIYPEYNLSLEDLWALHIGMEYFIKMAVTEESQRQPAKLLAYLKMVATVFQDQLYITLTAPPKIEKIYVVQEQRHVIGKVTYENKVYSWIVGDIPHFVYKKDLPAQVVWSLHLGRILLT